jgi:oxygen-independent coproporphyrinogen-3 oxidase
MIDCLRIELNQRVNYLQGKIVETIYFGGGTPSLLDKHELQLILNDVRALFPTSPDLEITLEANPDDITEQGLVDWTDIGVNRLSIGLQSFREEDLKWMNRAHTSEEALNCIKLAQDGGIKNISVDLMYGLPNLSITDWRKNVQTAIELGVPHVSAYCLTVEPKTALHKWVQTNQIVLSDEDQQSEQFEVLIAMLQDAGIEQYEISNFAKEGSQSKHNSNYWSGEHYVGIGPSAHSFNSVSRSWNVSNNHKYMEAILAKRDAFETEELTVEDRFNELIMTGLRTKYGVSMPVLTQIHARTSEFDTKLTDFIAQGLIIAENEFIRVSESGKLKADYLASELFLTK